MFSKVKDTIKKAFTWIKAKAKYVTIAIIALLGFGGAQYFGGSTISSSYVSTIATSTVQAIDKTNLIGYWSFEDGTGTKATDFSGNGNAGTTTAGTWTGGRVGTALNFNGTTNYVGIPNPGGTDVFDLGTGDFSISMWAKSTAVGDIGMFDRFVGTGGGQILMWMVSGKVQIYTYDGASTEAYRSTSSTVNDGQWHLVTGTRSGATMHMYVDGVLNEGSQTGTGPLNVNSTANINIGKYNYGASYFNGQLDEVRIYNTALTAAQISTLYNQSKYSQINAPQNDKYTDGLVGYWTFNGKDLTTTTATDVSGNGNHGTLTNSPVPTIGKVGQALNLPTTSDYVTAADSSSLDISTGVYTFSAWVKTSDLSNEMFVMGKDDLLGSGCGAYAMFIRTGYPVLFSSDYCNWGAASSTIIPSNTWVFLTMAFNGTTVSYYQNGVFTDSKTSDALTSATTGTFRLGNKLAGWGVNYTGSLDEVRLYNRVLSATEITALYRLGK